MSKTPISVLWINVNWIQQTQDDFISLTDIAKYKSDKPDQLIQNRMRNRNTVEFLWLWEFLHNEHFKPLEFEGFRKEAGLHAFVLSPQKWIEKVNAIGIISKSGRYGGTFAHSDIALEFANWISVEFKLYFIKEFQRVKLKQQENLDWNVKRFLTKVNYRIHTDAIRDNLIPPELSKVEMSIIYADEADVLNKALFGKTAKQRREENPDQKGNIRDYATLEQLIILANIESMNAQFIQMKMSQSQRLEVLNQTAIIQMKSLLNAFPQVNNSLHLEEKIGKTVI